LLEGLARLYSTGCWSGSASVFAGVYGATGTVRIFIYQSLRQNIIPDSLQARVTASHRFIVYGASAIGALLGGVLATLLGLHTALVLCAVGALLGPLYALSSPIRGVLKQPTDALGPQSAPTQWNVTG
jgi:hypothetical protein